MPALAKLSSRCFGTGWVKVRLKRINSGQSIKICSDRIPLPFIRRAQSITSPAPTSTFFGSHPRSAHVPPNGLESIIATCHPATRHRVATVEAPAPVPMATRSNFLVIFLFLNSPSTCACSTEIKQQVCLPLPCVHSNHASYVSVIARTRQVYFVAFSGCEG